MNRLQQSRLLRLNTLLGPDGLQVRSLTGTEAVSDLFSFTVDCLAEMRVPDPAALIATPAVISIRMEGETERHFHARIRDITYRGYGQGDHVHHYTLTLVPWFWLLSRHQDCRIFQDMAVPDVAETIFRDLGFTDYQFTLTGSYAKRVYCVQYRESSYDFLARLFAEEGIFFFFEHQIDAHRLIIADAPTIHRPVEGGDVMMFKRAELTDTRNAISDWWARDAVMPAQVTLRDFNFETPRHDLTSRTRTIDPMGATGALEFYDFPGLYPDGEQGERQGALRMEALEASRSIHGGRSNHPAFYPGGRFTLQGHPDPGCDGTYTLLSVRHEARNNWDLGDGGAAYANDFQCMDNSRPFRPERRHRKPVVEGPQTAFVVGPPGEEVHVDAHGRVRLQFHWDRLGQSDAHSSCWVRVAQGWAGAGFGQSFLPRVGMEVVVLFLEGDPDRPLIVGCIGNADTMPAYALPQNRTRSWIKTLSSPGGGGFNELRFEDKAGGEQVFLHAQRDLDVKVQATARTQTGGNHHLLVGGDRMETIGGEHHATVNGDSSARVAGTQSIHVQGERHDLVEQNYALGVGSQWVVEAGSTISLRVGGSFISIGPAGIVLQGPKVYINSGGSPAGLHAMPMVPLSADGAAGDRAGRVGSSNRRRSVVRERVTGWAVRQADAMRLAADQGAAFCEVPAAKDPPSFSWDETWRMGGTDNVDAIYTKTKGEITREGWLGRAEGEVEFGLAALTQSGSFFDGLVHVQHKLSTNVGKVKGSVGAVKGVGGQFSAEASKVDHSINVAVGSDPNNPFAQTNVGYKLLTAQARGGMLIGSDGRFSGIMGSLGATAKAAEGTVKGEINLPLPFTDRELSIRGAVSPKAGVGVDGSFHAVKDLQSGRYHVGVAGEVAAALGIGGDLDLSVGPPYQSTERPLGP
ncbi:type VI secretion system Vgr family protein [Niveispirillum irakense]|uniref:type VI secretion system Vgr family protein n=1 Tax=Niveispirillum irakense TaxID=34011 RepID=UPI000418CB93|nr:type VI secretion system tip protein TssI/VgrG [Niveispirillum irakense]